MGESQDIASTQRYKYNGKELDRMHGLDWYDYGARHFDASIGRWMCVDPLVEKYHGISPYAYCLNNPIRYVDPDGKIVVIDKNSTKEFIDAVYLAINFLREKGCGEFYEVLNASPNVYTIKEATGEASSFSWKTRTVEWAYKYGLNTGFTILSPATRLNHDLDHAARYDNDPIGFLADIKPIKEGEPDEFYHTKDDKRVIMNSEKQTAEALGEIKSGEITRDSHSGVSIETISPISNKPKKPLIEFEIVAPIINKQDLK
ncbi:RHS repeat-associated core domain-containing protein [Prevotella sp. KH2C16]|uniref:RHS repeat-associated core domain-containing protein n=1 Tax=Prevotella sp. KH2C16 TaxID=1855325 RepID=UPI0008E76C7A|nr:RHS repeat-associated core domain-containing protein [Prevotella sp. KH2C16]SFG78361.1 RHS repeat-associated core domain-containing protein [Prevotella sp. KH2C16]